MAVQPGNFEGTYKGNFISIGELPIDFIKVFCSQRTSIGQVVEELRDVLPNSPYEEGLYIAKQNISNASLCFKAFRDPVRDLLKTIVAFVFDEYDLHKSHGLDIGSGATGEMVEELLPINEEEKAGWTQTDVNPNAVKENKRRHPDSKIEICSYFDLKVQEVYRTITGLSCLDSTSFVEEVIGEIKNALVEEGVFMHFQEIRPGWNSPFKEMVKRGEKFPLVALLDPEVSGAHEMFPHNIMGYCSTMGDGFLSVMELFRRHLARAIGNVEGLEIILNDWVTAAGPTSDLSNGCVYNSGLKIPTPGNPYNIVSGIVTLVRKSVENG